MKDGVELEGLGSGFRKWNSSVDGDMAVATVATFQELGFLIKT